MNARLRVFVPWLLAAQVAAGVIQAADFSGLQTVPRNDLNSTLPEVHTSVSTGPLVAQGLDRHAGETLAVTASRRELQADGKSTTVLTIEAQDSAGLPLRRDVRIGVLLSRGRILDQSTDATLRNSSQSVDMRRRLAGIDLLAAGGRAQVTIEAPKESGVGTVLVNSGNVEVSTTLSFVAELRPLLAVGILDFAIRANGHRDDALATAIPADGLEDELQQIGVHRSGENSITGNGRGAVFAKGTVHKDYLLTLSYDSDRDRTRFFRDIQPDQFYPIYGDSSIRGFDAQTTRNGYLRVEKGRSYFLFGDFNTESLGSPARSLGAYQRTLTGGQQHFESANGAITLFASQDTLRRVVDEQPGRGLSGPYQLSNGNGVLGSEVIEIVTRDRNQPAVILDVQRLARYTDYDFEPFSGQILFRRPIPTVDSNLNPVSIRVTYEIDGGGAKFWVSGGNAQWKLGKAFELGGSFADSADPLTPYRLYSGNATWKIGQDTTWLFEGAHSSSNLTVVQPGRAGNGFRTELLHTGERLDARLFYGSTDRDFDNATSVLTAGRKEASAKLTYAITPGLQLQTEGTQTADALIGAERTGASLLLAKFLGGRRYRLDLGFRYGKDQTNSAYGATAQPTYSSVYSLQPTGTLTGGAFSNGAYSNGQIVANEFTTVHTRATAAFTPKLNGYVEGDVGVQSSAGSGRNVWGYALGADYLVHERTRLYVRQEQATSVGGLYGLGTGGQHTATLLGVSTNYSDNGQLFSEYRMSDALDGRQSQAAVGLRNLWRLRNGLALTGNVEQLRTLDGSSQRSLATGLGVEYTASPTYKSSARLERRDDPAAVSWLSTLAFTLRLNDDWSVLLRNLLNSSAAKGASKGSLTQDRAILGLAYRDSVTNHLSSLVRFELKQERDSTSIAPIDRLANVVSWHMNYKPGSNLTLASELAAKWTHEHLSDAAGTLDSSYAAQLAALRIIRDLGERWDIGVMGAGLNGQGGTRQYAAGVELGRILTRNLWLSAGYNVAGFRDRDLAEADAYSRGVYLRLRYKFDEKLFTRSAPAAAPPPPPPPVVLSPPPAPLPPPVVLDADQDGVPDAQDRCPETPHGAAVDAQGCELDDDHDGVVNRLDTCPDSPPGARVDEVGCEAARILSVVFDNDSDHIRPESFVSLNRFADYLLATRSLRGVIEGHTDSNGGEAYNQQLSEKRAEAVKRYVVERGVDVARLTAKGFGETQPVATNDTPAGRARNRRVVFKPLPLPP